MNSSAEKNLICLCGETECVFFNKKYIIEFISKNIKNFSTNALEKIINSTFFIVTGSSKYNLESATNIFHWDTYWFYKTNNSILTINNEKEYRYHFICMNGRIRPHRALFIDSLYKENLFDNGCISWLNFKINEGEDSYQFKHWTPKTMHIDITNDLLAGVDEKFIPLLQGITKNTKGGLQYNPPIQYYQSFMQIVTETQIYKHFITEKTVIPLILAKPFLAVSSKNYHKILTYYGFKLYDEIFDYTFDGEDLLEKRIKGIIDNVKKISILKLSECKKMRVKILDKLVYNKELALKIANNHNLIPELYIKHRDSFRHIKS